MRYMYRYLDLLTITISDRSSVSNFANKLTFVSDSPPVPIQLQIRKILNYAIQEDTQVSVAQICQLVKCVSLIFWVYISTSCMPLKMVRLLPAALRYPCPLLADIQEIQSI